MSPVPLGDGQDQQGTLWGTELDQDPFDGGRMVEVGVGARVPVSFCPKMQRLEPPHSALNSVTLGLSSHPLGLCLPVCRMTTSYSHSKSLPAASPPGSTPSLCLCIASSRTPPWPLQLHCMPLLNALSALDFHTLYPSHHSVTLCNIFLGLDLDPHFSYLSLSLNFLTNSMGK